MLDLFILVTPKATKRGRKRTKVTSVSKSENEETIVPPVGDESKQNNDQKTDQVDEENSSAQSKVCSTRLHFFLTTLSFLIEQ